MMKILLLSVLVICAATASNAEEIETRKTVKKALAVELKNEVEARTDLPESETIKVETFKDTTSAEITTTKAPATTVKTSTTTLKATTTTIPPATTTKVASTTAKQTTVAATSTTTEKTTVVTTPEADTQITSEISTSSAQPTAQTTTHSFESSNSAEEPDNGSSEDNSSSNGSNNIFQSVDPPKRKVIYVNQQQSGKLNVHLELSDVSVIVIPNQKDPQLSLLSLLFRSAQKSKMQHEAKKKEESLTSAEQHDDYSKYKQIVRPTDETYHLGATGTPFVESRAPYKVDISSTIGQQSQPAVDISPNAHQQSNPSAMPQFQPQFARSPIMQLLKPIPFTIHAAPGQMAHTNRIFKRSLDSRQYGFDDEIPHDNENTVNYNEDELTESYLNSLNSLDNGEDLSDYENNNDSEFVLLGATENCGPGRKRNSYQICVSANME